MAALQVASVCRQRLYWAGCEDVLDLAGSNINTLLSICQHTWESWQRAQPEWVSDLVIADQVAPVIDVLSQDSGINATSDYWYRDKVLESPEGHDLRDFLDFVGVMLKKTMLNDLDMSYPGRNGFSVKTAELNDPANRDVFEFLELAVSYGHVVKRSHSTKSSDRMKRTKYYLRPILCPHYQLPLKMLQEPMYVTAAELRAWVASSRPNATEVSKRRRPRRSEAGQLDLFRAVE